MSVFHRQPSHPLAIIAPSFKPLVLSMTPLDPQACYRALQSRDARFDGHFYVGVHSTGIYCRPICPARTPQAQGCSFFRHAAAAEAAGFRPCLRCRPELAPGLAQVDSRSELAQAALRLMERHLAELPDLHWLAARLGVSDRHLRRLFQSCWGMSANAMLQHRRLWLAKQLLTDTDLDQADIAVAVGLGSSRRLYDLFQRHYRLSPSQLRRQRSPQRSALCLPLGVRPPYDFAALIHFFSKRSVNGIEQVSQQSGEQCYRRTLRLYQQQQVIDGWLEVRFQPQSQRLLLQLAPQCAPVLADVLTRVRHLFDVDADPAPVQHCLGELARARPGLRVPGCFDSFESCCYAILGQQVSVQAARTLMARLSQAFGEPCVSPWPELNRHFPRPERLAQLSVAELASQGMPGKRAATLLALAQHWQQLNLYPGAPVEPALQSLQALPGIGPWTAHYIALRVLGWPDAFPHSDHGLKLALQASPAAILRQAEAWRPWRGYALMHLWQQLEPNE